MQAEIKGQIINIACILLVAGLSTSLAYHALFCIMSLYGGGHLGRDRALLSHVEASSKENREQYRSDITKSLLALAGRGSSSHICNSL